MKNLNFFGFVPELLVSNPRGTSSEHFGAKSVEVTAFFQHLPAFTFGLRPRDHQWSLHALELRMHQTSSREHEIEAVLWHAWSYQEAIKI